MKLHQEEATLLSRKQELSVVRRAYERSPSHVLRPRLAALLMADDDLPAIVSLLRDAKDLGAGEALLLAQALLAEETQAGNEAALVAVQQSLLVLEGPEERAVGLALRGKVETRLGRLDAARASLAESLRLDPHNKDACKRMAALALSDNRPDAVIKLYQDLHGQGAAHSRLFAARALADARRGDVDAAADMIGSDAFFAATRLSAPPGWDSIEAFNADLAEELVRHPELRFERYGSASELTWRIDWLPHSTAPLTRLLLESIAAAVAEHADRVGEGSGHPWAAAKPDEALLRSWCVITESEGYETWHVHQFGWLSGAYYVQVPDEIVAGEDEAGCIALGLPEDLAGDEAAAAYGLRHIRPESGLLLLFPSHTYHRTFPHGARSRRICVAFDVKPIAARRDAVEASA